MRAASLVFVLAVPGVASGAGEADPFASAGIVGDYLEARTADVYTGPCFANGEVNLDGQEAVMAWRVRRGGWQGVELAGLTVVAAIQARGTLGDPFAEPHQARSVIVVDERATLEQRQALVSFAQVMGGELLGDVLSVRSAPIEARFDAGPGRASVRAGDLIEARTRPLGHGDHLCGNESVYYPPLSSLDASEATPAFALANAFRGDALDVTWSTPDKRSAFVGVFAR
jgi:hypothetical protein